MKLGPSQGCGFLLVGSVRSHGSHWSHGSHRSHGSLFFPWDPWDLRDLWDLWDLRDLKDLRDLRDPETQDKTRHKKSNSDVASTTDNEWLRQTTLKRSTFSKKLSLSNSLRAKQEILWWNAWTSPSGMQLVFDCLFCCLLVIIHDILHIAPCQFQCISEMFTSQFQYPYSKIFLFHPKMMNTITKNGVHRTTVRSEQLS